MAEVSVQLFMRGQLEPGESRTFFRDDVSSTKVRTFGAVPVNTVIDGHVLNDQFVEVTNVFHILKGRNHEIDGTGGKGTIQVNVTVRNRDPVHPAIFDLYMAELG